VGNFHQQSSLCWLVRNSYDSNPACCYDVLHRCIHCCSPRRH